MAGTSFLPCRAFLRCSALAVMLFPLQPTPLLAPSSDRCESSSLASPNVARGKIFRDATRAHCLNLLQYTYYRVLYVHHAPHWYSEDKVPEA